MSIDSQRWEQLKSILSDALQQESTTARQAFLTTSCGNDHELLSEAQSILSEAETLLRDANDDLEACADNSSDRLRREIVSEIGQRIGAYVITRRIGRGGMGTVYLAARADGYFEKEVAIKLLSPGANTQELLRRFRVEREALARLDHPNIARLLDAGRTDDGRPYFVMDYVDGVPVTRFVEANDLAICARLSLFLKICDAVEAAHIDAIVHRDLKASNILVTRKGEPKLLDFGIAKVLHASAELDEPTASGQDLLTPVSASPEQARGEPVTTSTDVYALGVLLYEILTAQGPYRFSGRNLSHAEVLATLCEQAPRLPSSVVTDAKMKRCLIGDLDAIVLRALAKEPGQRYPSVESLAADLRRCLAREVVQARAEERPEFLRGAILRNRWLKPALLAIGFALLRLARKRSYPDTSAS